MTLLLKQSQNEMHESIAFSRNAEMVGIKASSASFSVSQVASFDTQEELAVGIRIEPRDALVIDREFHATTFFECVIGASAKSKNVDPVAKFECSLMATYHIRDEYHPTEAELSAFHKVNVVFNCWPYFREFVQSSACRMNVESPPIPLIRVQVTPAKGAVAPLTRKKAAKTIAG